MSELPDDLRRKVVAEVYRQAGELDWDGLTDRQRSTLYDRWLDDPGIGSQLTRYLTRERARVWLKDVPMKEYARARSGIGVYADLVTVRLPSPSQIAQQVLGGDWSMVEGSVREKPNQCLITNGREQRLMMWGPPKTLRDLVWAGINAVVDGEHKPLIVVATPQGQRLSEAEKHRHVLVGKVAGLDVRHTVLRITRVSRS